MKKIIVTGGYGFIGSAIIRKLIKTNKHILNIDSLTYASDLKSLPSQSKNYQFIKLNICNYNNLKKTILKFKPDLLIHCAAETHVDNSINSPYKFIKSNIIGTYNLLQICTEYYKNYNNKFIFHHISTDEVFGELTNLKDKFNEESLYKPNSPYSASKASSDHLVSSWRRTYGLPANITNCSNNYGPYQNKEKLIPVIIKNCFFQKKIPIYGKGLQRRDWLYVDDHANAILKISKNKIVNENFCISGNYETSNIELCKKICIIMDGKYPKRLKNIKSHLDLIDYVKDRPGHDFRYAINSSKIKKYINWIPKVEINTGLKNTINFYSKNYLK